MWIALSVPVLLLFCGGALVAYGLMVAISVGVKIAVYTIIFIFYLVLSISLIWLISIPYRGCKTKEAKFFYSFCVSICLVILLGVFLFKLKTTTITVLNDSKNDVITEIKIVPIGDESYSYKPNPKEITVFNYKDVDYKIRFTDEMTERCKKLGFNYKKGQEWHSLTSNQKCMVSGLWQSESYTFNVPKGTWIITLKTINRSTENFYYVIYDKNAFCTHIGESLSFSYSGEDISMTEHQKASFMPEIIDKHLEKEVSKKFEPNLIIIKKESANYVSSGLLIHNEAQTFPNISKGKYSFKCILPNTYSAEAYFSEWNKESHSNDEIRKEMEITINKDYVVFYIDEDKKTIKQINSSINYKKFKLEN